MQNPTLILQNTLLVALCSSHISSVCPVPLISLTSIVSLIDKDDSTSRLLKFVEMFLTAAMKE
jgi:hypothetical protein